MIADSSSLIIFAKINKLSLIIEIYGKIYITEVIYKEIVEDGLKINAPDAKILKKFIDNKNIIILHLNKKYNNFSKELKKVYYQIDIEESDAIALALQEKNKNIIMDEALGRKIAKLYGIKPIGSLKVLIEAYKKDFINETELRNIIKEMIENKFRIGADVINEFWNIFNKIKRNNQPN
ncbi:hypothetical protein J4214_05170 [Candidatus Woesearchaeota archaeon]|nr:hypothetical protein [Candidatus Woesearchaeota archaeon]